MIGGGVPPSDVAVGQMAVGSDARPIVWQPAASNMKTKKRKMLVRMR
jgi:hypothetical protein